MTARPDVLTVRTFLRRALARLAWLRAAEGAAIALVVAALTGWSPTLAIVGAIVGAAVVYLRRDWIARIVEARAPECRNLLFTVNELSHSEPFDFAQGKLREESPGGGSTLGPGAPREVYPERSRRARGDIVWRAAARLVGSLDLRSILPARRALTALATSVAIWTAAIGLRSDGPLLMPNGPGGSPAIESVDVTVTPPAYATGRRRQTVRDPSRVEALVGSRISLTIRARANAVGLETLGGRRTLTPTGRGTFAAELTAETDGYVALEPTTTERTGTRRVIGLTVVPDAPPRVRVTAPGRDVVLPDGRRAIDLSIDADDD